MNKCLWCKEEIAYTYTFFELFIYDKGKSPICDFCCSKLETLKDTTHCLGCGRKQESTSLCSDCLEWKKLYPNEPFKHMALFTYNSFAKEYMEKFKIMGDCELAGLFSQDLKLAVKQFGKEAVIVPIPISQRSQQERGFNQIELLLQKARISYIPLLKNNSKQEKQSKKDKRERMLTSQPFEVEDTYAEKITDKAIVIIDDIYTTGRTVFHAADSIRPYKPSKIVTLSLFR